MEQTASKQVSHDQPEISAFRAMHSSAQSSSPKTPDGLSGLRIDDAEASLREGHSALDDLCQIARSPPQDQQHHRFPRVADGATSSSRRVSGASSDQYALPVPIKLPEAVMLSVANLEQAIRAAFYVFVRGGSDGGGGALAATCPALPNAAPSTTSGAVQRNLLPATLGNSSAAAEGDGDPPPPLLPLVAGPLWDATPLHHGDNFTTSARDTNDASYRHHQQQSAVFLRDVQRAIRSHTAVLREEWALQQAAAAVVAGDISPSAASAVAAGVEQQHHHAVGGSRGGGGLEASISYFDQEPPDELSSVQLLVGVAADQPLERGASSSRFNASVFDSEDGAHFYKTAHDAQVSEGPALVATTSPTDLLFRWRCTESSLDELQTPSGATTTTTAAPLLFHAVLSQSQHEATPRRASEPRKPTSTESPSSQRQQLHGGGCRNPRLRILLHHDDLGAGSPLACGSPSPGGAIADAPPTNAQRRSFRMQRKFHIQVSPRPSLSCASEAGEVAAASLLVARAVVDQPSAPTLTGSNNGSTTASRQQPIPSILLSSAAGSSRLMTAERGDGEQHAAGTVRPSGKEDVDAAVGTTVSALVDVLSDDDDPPPLQRKDTAPSIASSSISEYYDRTGDKRDSCDIPRSE